MTTTTLRLEAPLRQRIADLAEAMGQSPHGFMVDALAEKVEEAEWKLAIQQEAARRDAALQTTQQALDWHDVRAWALARAAQKPGAKPLKPPRKRSLANISAATPE